MSATLEQITEQIDQVQEKAITIKNQRDDARAALLDIISGCDQMLQPALQVKGSLRSFIEEVKRVAKAGLT